MIVKDEFLNKLRHYFGLNLYEVRIWTALLSRGVSTAGELSDIGNVPRSRAYDVLESLEKKSFITMKLGKPIKYLAVEPKEVLERAKKLVKRTAEIKSKKLDNLKGTGVLKELNSLFNQGIDYVEPTDLSGAIRGRHNIYTHLETMIKAATKSVTLVTTSKGVLRKTEALKPELEKLFKKGVKIKVAAPVTSETKDAIRELAKIAEVKSLGKHMTARFCVVDDTDLMFMVLNDENIHPTYDVGVWVKTPFFATAVNQMFEVNWQKMDSASKVKV